jgi:hypothetical protein
MDMVRGGTGVLLAIPLMCLALHCHCFVPLIYSEIKPELKSVAFMNRVIMCSFSICIVLCLVVGSFGYYQFGSGVPQDVLTGYATSNKAADVARISILCTATFCIPICNFAVCTAVYGFVNQRGWWINSSTSDRQMLICQASVRAALPSRSLLSSQQPQQSPDGAQSTRPMVKRL